MKTLLIITGLLSQLSNAQATQYVVHVNHMAGIQPTHQALSSLLQSDITIDTSSNTVKVRLGQSCSLGICTEMLRIYPLQLTAMGNVIQAEGSLPLAIMALQNPGKVVLSMTKTADNSTIITIRDQNGTSTFVGSPIQEANTLF